MTHAPPMPNAAPTFWLWVPLIGANLAAWAWAWMMFADTSALLGTALLAWIFGLRHAVDADHIAAIDNVTRNLLHRGAHKHVGHVGLYFSLGHSTVVFLAAFLVAGAAAAWPDRLLATKTLLAPLGSWISAVFLLLIAAANATILRGLWRDFRHLRANRAMSPRNTSAPQPHAAPMTRAFSQLPRKLGKAWHMYPLGFLFALGFDTATEIGLLSLAASQTAPDASPWQMLAQILVFPALFTAAMALVDTADTLLMLRAYAWAFTHPLRKLWYNLTITAASVLVALLIGGITALDQLSTLLAPQAWPRATIADLNQDLASFGIMIVGIFALCWAISAAVYRWKGYDAVVQRG